MEIIKLKFLKKWRWHEPGEVFAAPPNFVLVAHKLIKDGIAERYIPQEVETKPETMG